jgi:serine/threonine protein kinase
VNKNHYEFNYVIGRGGFGKVWRVEKKISKLSFALKEISKVKIYEKNSVPCVINERKLLALLRHP